MEVSASSRCWICGQETTLTDEHIPPKKAFNTNTIFLQTYEDFNKNAQIGSRLYGQTVQGGFRRKTLCASCNNRTGAYYGGAFVDFAKNCASVLERALEIGDQLPTTSLKTFPLRVAKQILTMFLSVAGEAFCDKHPHLRKYVLERKASGCLPDVRLYCYGNPNVVNRIVPLTAQRSPLGDHLWISEIGTWPLGYVLAVDCEIRGSQLCELTHLLDHDVDHESEITMTIPLLPVSTMFPLDFRTAKDVGAEYLKNISETRTPPSAEEKAELRQELGQLREGLERRAGITPSTIWIGGQEMKHIADNEP